MKSLRNLAFCSLVALAAVWLPPSESDGQRYVRPIRQGEPKISPQASGQGSNAVVQEAERLVTRASQGRVITQNMRQFGNWSGGQQILWIENRPGQRLELHFDSPRAGRFPVTVYLTKAADFADLAIGSEGRQLADFSGFSPTVSRAAVALGQLDLRAGRNTLIFHVTGKDRRSTGYRVGIDSVQVAVASANSPPAGNTPPHRQPGPLETGNPGLPGDASWPAPPSGLPEGVHPEMNPDSQPHLQPVLPGGADLYVRSGDFVERAPRQLKTGDYTLSLTYDVSKVAGAGAVTFQIVNTPFKTQAEGDGYPESSPHSLLQSGRLPGAFGHFTFDIRQFTTSSKPVHTPREYRIRVIPVVSTTNPLPVGKASNVIEVYYNKDLPGGNNFELVNQLQVQAFADMVESRLQDKTSGYAFTVISPNQTPVNRSGGFARTSASGSARGMTVHDRVNVASVTKLITAIAVIKALDTNPDVSLESKIHSFLPASWPQGPNVESVTFREVLRHSSGFRPDAKTATDDAGLKKMIATGIPDIATKIEWKYVNHNFGLMRLLLPKITDIAGQGSDGAKFVREVNRSVLAPAGIKWVSGTPDAATALSYPFPAGDFQGSNWDAKLERVGSSGLHLSASELAVLMDQLANTGKVMRADLRNEMVSWELGCRKHMDAGGQGFGKGGYLRWNDPTDPNSSPANRAEMNTLIYAFSDGTAMGLVVNSSFADSPNAPPHFLPILLDCFKACYRPF